MSEHLYTYINPPNEKDLKRICHLLENDGLIALPMDTNWAFCWDPTSKKAIQKLGKIKPNNQEHNPFSIICGDLSMAATMVQIGNSEYRLLKRILPGPFTAILKSQPSLPKRLHDKRQTVGIRIPNEQITRDLIQYWDKPLAATSIPLDADNQIIQMGYQVFELFGHGIDMVVDIGEELPGGETTVVDLTTEEIEILRIGVGDIALLD